MYTLDMIFAIDKNIVAIARENKCTLTTGLDDDEWTVSCESIKSLHEFAKTITPDDMTIEYRTFKS
jgi:hypothetical protein